MKSVSRSVSVLLLLALLLTLLPGATTTASAASCYWAQFVADVTVPDGTSFAPGTAFKKTWRLKNIGTCAWSNTDVSLIFDSGERMGAPASLALPTTVNPGQTVDITVDMTAPSAAGHYFGYWKFKSNSGGVFGIGSTANKSFWVEIRTASSAGAAYDFTSNAASAAWSSGTGALTFPGTDGNANGFGLSQANPKMESGVTSAQAGLLFAPNNITNGYVQASYPAFRVLNGDRFQATIGCEQGATTCYIAYSLNYQIGSGPVKTFWTFREKYEGWTYNVNLDLSSLANQDVKFTLVVSAYGSPAGDRALWVNPIISRAGGGNTVTATPTVTGTPPSPTPTSTGTVQPNACDRAQFVSDVTVPDGTSFAPGIGFNKTWRLKNVGTCTWTNYSIMFDSGEKMGGPDSALIPTSVAPGQTVDITLQLTSPTTAGTYRGYWKLKNNTGVPFGIGSAGTKSFWVEIKVSGTGINPGTITVTIPAATTAATTVTPVAGTSFDFAANACAATWYSGAGQLPCPGTNGDAKGFVLVTTPSKLENGTNDSRTSLLTFPQNINNGYIQGIFPSYKVKTGDRFRTTVGCENGATSCYVVFRLDYSISGSSTIQTHWAFVEKYEGAVYNADIDLSALAGKDVKFILTVLSTGSPSGDRALWTAPIIYNSSTSASNPTATNTVAASSATPTATTSASTATFTVTVPAASETPTPTSTTGAPTETVTNTPSPSETPTPTPTP
ncbi:MAG TPA: NBR1-Ig-like domain-containing protein [Anaerolineales bacterium]|nr:NBR1-Ig-like domain-containing protein [Anaerolineales bacterium]